MSHRATALVFAVLAVLGVSACGGSGGGELRGIQQQPLPDVSGVSLPDATAGDADFQFRAAADGVLLVYFGYTACPDVCPTTLSDIRAALRRLDEADADRVDLAMVTIDPDRDTGEVLTDYVQSFLPASHALVTTDDALLETVAGAFGASYEVVPASDGGEPEVAHSAFVYAVDDQGRVELTWSFGTPPEDFANDLGILLSK